ncbi:MAG: hypothetical protein AAFN77_02595 [Planctomycetota bacterium]
MKYHTAMLILSVSLVSLACSVGVGQEVLPDFSNGTSILVKDKDGVMVERPVYTDPAANVWVQVQALKGTISNLEKLGLVDIARYLSTEQLLSQVDFELTTRQRNDISSLSQQIRATETNAELDELGRLKKQIQLLKQLKDVFLPNQLKSISKRAQEMRGKRFYSRSLYGEYGKTLDLSDEQMDRIEKRCKKLNDELKEARAKVLAIENEARAKYVAIFDEVYTPIQKKSIESGVSFKAFTFEMSLKDLISDTVTRDKE